MRETWVARLKKGKRDEEEHWAGWWESVNQGAGSPSEQREDNNDPKDARGRREEKKKPVWNEWKLGNRGDGIDCNDLKQEKGQETGTTSQYA